jgi:hypothetical protein
MKKSILALSILLSTSVMADYKVIMSGKSGNITIPEKPEPVTNFTSHTFTSCGKAGRLGPSLSQCQAAYSGSELLSGDYGFSVNQGIQSFVIPETGEYRIKAYGPRGVNNNNNVGKGAIMQGTFSLSSGDKIQILVGQLSIYHGTRDWQGGSGGTFVALGESNSSATPLVVAGAGGTNRSSTLFNTNMDARTGTNGKNGNGSIGGQNGNASSGGGHNQDTLGGGASGFYSSAASKKDERYGGPYTGSSSFISGGIGGDFIGNDGELNGGFGGGGPGGWGGSGGGGGYSGGGNSGNSSEINIHYSGGGGSFISANAISAGTSNGIFQITGNEPTSAYTGPVQNLGGFNSGAGKVIIEKL